MSPGLMTPNGSSTAPGTGPVSAGSGTAPVSPTGPVPTNSNGTPVTPVGSGTGAPTTAPTMEPPAPGVCDPTIPSTTQLPRLTPIQYDNVMRDLLKVTDLGGKTPSVALGLEENRGNMTSTEWTAYQKVAGQIAKAVMAGANKTEFIKCDPAAAGCLDTTIREFGLKAFRRPLTDPEVAAFLEFDNLTPKGEPAAVAEAILNAFLVSPSFIMLPELNQEKDASNNFKLSPYEVATRLATLIWRSTPDDILLAAAKDNQLNTKEQILSQAERMIAVKEKSGALLADYHRFYADIRQNAGHWNRTKHDTAKLPQGVTEEALSAAMMDEVSAFFAEVAGTGSYKDLFLSPVAFVNKTTAPLYGLDPAMYTDELQKVELSATERPGFLTRIGFLSSYSGYDETSPILRGAYISQNMLGAPAVAPVQGVPTEPPAGDYMTKREKVDALTAPDDCASCHHVFINPPGYVMEVFDTLGKVQTQDPLGGPINSTADILVDGKTITMSTPLELMQAIATGTSGQRMYAQRWVEYATGRSPNNQDNCAVEALSMKLSTDGTYTIVKLLADLSQTEPFTLRTVGN